MNRRNALYLVGLSLLTIPSLSLHSTTEKVAGNIKEHFQNKYRNLRSVIASFTGPGGTKGTLTALRSGAFRLVLADRTIVCDGNTVWNISHADKTVVVNKYSASDNEMSLDKIFFAAMNVYNVEILQDGKTSGKLRLTPPTPQVRISTLSAIELTLNKKTDITQIMLTELGSTSTYAITSISTNRPIKHSVFTYSVPTGWKQIDLR